MKYILKTGWTIFCFIILGSYLISCCSAFVPPLRFSFITLFAVAFPYLFLLVLITGAISLFLKKSLAVVLFVCLLAGYYNLSHTIAFHFPSKWQTETRDSSVRIMTWNVQDFVDLTEKSSIRGNMLNVIAEYKPDVVCMQEFTNVENGKRRISVRREMDSMGYKFYYFSNDRVFHLGKTEIARGVALFSRYAFTDSGRVNINKSETSENLAYVSMLLNNKLLRIYTAHLASFALYRDTAAGEKDVYQITYDRKRDIQFKLRETEQLHQRQVTIIGNAISQSPYPVIYCGDMNTTPCSYNYRLLKNNLRDAFLTKGSGIGATFYKILPTLRIDVCFADTSLKIEQCAVINRKLSDHYPLITDISWK
jgi:endonuclease/exonuclease/phosphatase family metal-dependent hydrolase